MIKHWLVTADCHGSMGRFLEIENKIKALGYDSSECGVVVLGDVGFNFYLNNTDKKLKNKFITDCNYTIYCIKGNHEARPTDIDTYEEYDYDVCGRVLVDAISPRIRYFKDWTGESYTIQGYKVLTIGGAYSVDKQYRLDNHWPWFSNEQLTKSEMEYIEQKVTGNGFDFVFSHTCPLSWQPTDLFLDFIDQDAVDNTMEVWLEKIRKNINFKYYLFGHYHTNRKIKNNVYILYTDLIKLEDIINNNIKLFNNFG